MTSQIAGPRTALGTGGPTEAPDHARPVGRVPNTMGPEPCNRRPRGGSGQPQRKWRCTSVGDQL
eukprot:12274495-Alexandrium_andersonii.AAC.1